MTTPMIFIAHRGLLDGPNPKLENRPDQIEKVMKTQFYAEIDVRFQDGEWWLGHDKADYQVDFNFLYRYRKKLFIHAKNIETLYQLIQVELAQKFIKNLIYPHKMDYFFHDKDDCTLTSRGYIWTYPNINLPLTKRSIAVVPERVPDWKIDKNVCYGICTDYPIDQLDYYYGL